MLKKGIGHFATFIIITFLLPNGAYAGYPNGYPPAKNCNIQKSLDSLKQLTLFNRDTLEISRKKISSTPNLVYEVKIAAIDRLSPIAFDFNPYVKRYIDIYTIERREQVGQMLGLAELYFPIFDEMLDKHNLPLELKYLAVVESALNSLAVSPSGAVGLWQFMINSGRMFNLEVNSYIDERMDPIKSTEAACRYLDYLYRIFGDWHLVMAAYNAGPGVVRNAIARANGETNFWKLYEYLPEAAQNYVPAFIAATYVLQNASAHNISAIRPIIKFDQINTIDITEPVSFHEISAVTEVPCDIIRFLNPSYRRGYVPKPENSTSIYLPIDAIPLFIENEQSIYHKTQPKANYHERVANAGSKANKQKVFHIVQPGEYLHKIAIEYYCTVDDILIWNPISASELSAGDTLEIWANKNILQRITESSVE